MKISSQYEKISTYLYANQTLFVYIFMMIERDFLRTPFYYTFLTEVLFAMKEHTLKIEQQVVAFLAWLMLTDAYICLKLRTPAVGVVWIKNLTKQDICIRIFTC